MKTIVLCLLLLINSVFGATVFVFQGSQDSLAHGQTRNFNSGNASFNTNTYAYNWLTAGPMEYFSFHVSSTISGSSDYWDMSISSVPSFVSPRLEVGFYSPAFRNRRTDGFAEFDLSGNGSGSGYNMNTGWFEVIEIGRDSSGKITKLAFDFCLKELHFDGSTSGEMTGSFRLDSSVVVIPESSTLGLLVLSLSALLKRRR